MIFGIVGAIALLLIVLMFYFNSNSYKGRYGEKQTFCMLKKLISDDEHIVNNLKLRDDSNGKTSQIDHVVVSRRGIFVIETKNYLGNIYGSDNNYEWTQVLRYGKVKNKFYSPVKQNNTHIYILNKLLNNQFFIHNIVIFTKGNINNIQSKNVFSMMKFRQYYLNCDLVFTIEEVKNIYKYIVDKHQITINNQQHRKNIKVMKNNIERNICPNCGSMLVKKTSKYGEFYGCSNYPNCKFVKKMRV